MKIVASNLHLSNKTFFELLFDEAINNKPFYLNGIRCIDDTLKSLNVRQDDESIYTKTLNVVGNLIPKLYKNLNYKSNVYIMVLNVSKPHKLSYSQKEPLLFQENKFLNIKKGDLIEIDQYKEIALFWDKTIDVAMFLTYK